MILLGERLIEIKRQALPRGAWERAGPAKRQALPRGAWERAIEIKRQALPRRAWERGGTSVLTFCHRMGINLSVYSHSIVAGGLLETSYVTRDTCSISLMIRFDTFSSSSYGRCAQRAVIKSMVSTARSAITHS